MPLGSNTICDTVNTKLYHVDGGTMIVGAIVKVHFRINCGFLNCSFSYSGLFSFTTPLTSSVKSDKIYGCRFSRRLRERMI